MPNILGRLFEEVVERDTLLFCQIGRYLLGGDLIRRVGELTDKPLPKFRVYAVSLEILVHYGQLLKLFKGLIQPIPSFLLIVDHELHDLLSEGGAREG